jgi:hypothetical protein
MASISWCNAEMALQLIRRCILSQLDTFGVSLVGGANVIARLGDDLEKCRCHVAFRQGVCPLTKLATAVG